MVNSNRGTHLSRFSVLRSILVAVVVMGGATSQAEEGGGDLRAAVQNPISSLYSLPFKFQFDYGADNGEASFLSIQPVIPVTVGDWNLVNRVIAPLIDTPDHVKGIPSNNRPTRCLPSRSGSGKSRETS